MWIQLWMHMPELSYYYLWNVLTIFVYILSSLTCDVIYIFSFVKWDFKYGIVSLLQNVGGHLKL